MGSSLYVAGFCATAFQFHLRPVKQKWVGPKEILKISAYRTITIPVPRLPPIPIMDITRAPYDGSSRKFILALDIGTTFSGAAYAFLDPGKVPQIRPVTKQALPPIPDPVTRRDKQHPGTSTVRMLGPQRFPPHFITITAAFSVASLRTGLISLIAISFSR